MLDTLVRVAGILRTFFFPESITVRWLIPPTRDTGNRFLRVEHLKTPVSDGVIGARIAFRKSLEVRTTNENDN
jgi:hypothetical protein